MAACNAEKRLKVGRKRWWQVVASRGARCDVTCQLDCRLAIGIKNIIRKNRPYKRRKLARVLLPAVQERERERHSRIRVVADGRWEQWAEVLPVFPGYRTIPSTSGCTPYCRHALAARTAEKHSFRFGIFRFENVKCHHTGNSAEREPIETGAFTSAWTKFDEQKWNFVSIVKYDITRIVRCSELCGFELNGVKDFVTEYTFFI